MSTNTPEPITDGYRIDRGAAADIWMGAATKSSVAPEPVAEGLLPTDKHRP